MSISLVLRNVSGNQNVWTHAKLKEIVSKEDYVRENVNDFKNVEHLQFVKEFPLSELMLRFSQRNSLEEKYTEDMRLSWIRRK